MNGPGAPNDQPSRDEMIELYKVATESAERVSDRRLAANSFHLTIVSALFAAYFASFAEPAIPQLARAICCTLGMAICLVWVFSIVGFRRHNSVKFRAIDDIEEHLSFKFFRTEERYFSQNKLRWRFTTVEFLLPLASFFAFLFLLTSANSQSCHEEIGAGEPAQIARPIDSEAKH